MCSFLIYILTLSLQLSGSILLLISSFGKIQLKVINDCAGGSSMLISKNGIVNLGKKNVCDSLRNVYMNRISFSILSIGYLSSIFDTYAVDKWEPALFLTIIFTVAIIAISFVLSNIIAKVKANKYCKVQVKDLPCDTIVYKEFSE